jgi:hypothetical protein
MTILYNLRSDDPSDYSIIKGCELESTNKDLQIRILDFNTTVDYILLNTDDYLEIINVD